MEDTAKVTSKGQITLPVAVRRELGLSAGDRVAFRKTSDGRYELVPKKHVLADLRGIIKLDRSVTTEDIDRWVDEARGTRARKALD